jgi:hypothetical protein
MLRALDLAMFDVLPRALGIIFFAELSTCHREIGEHDITHLEHVLVLGARVDDSKDVVVNSREFAADMRE